jgi:hypothetical protein
MTVLSVLRTLQLERGRHVSVACSMKLRRMWRNKQVLLVYVTDIMGTACEVDFGPDVLPEHRLIIAWRTFICTLSWKFETSRVTSCFLTLSFSNILNCCNGTTCYYKVLLLKCDVVTHID